MCRRVRPPLLAVGSGHYPPKRVTLSRLPVAHSASAASMRTKHCRPREALEAAARGAIALAPLTEIATVVPVLNLVELTNHKPLRDAAELEPLRQKILRYAGHHSCDLGSE